MNRASIILLIAILSVSAIAQENQRRIRIPKETAKARGYIYSRGEASEPINILRMPEAHKELQLTEGQVHLVDKLCNEFESQIRQVVMSMQFGIENRQEVVDMARQNVWRELKPDLEGIMSPDQRSRLSQLRVQMISNGNGIVGVAEDTKLANALNISPEQSADIRKQYFKKSRELAQRIKQMEEAFEKEMFKELLAPKQLNRFQELSGDQFVYKRDG